MIWIAAARVFFNLRPAGISQSQHLGDFIERFASSIVDSSADQLIIAEATHEDRHRVSAADDKRNVRADSASLLYVSKERREQMSFEMIDGEVRFSKTDCQSLGNRRTDHERTRQARSAGRRKCIHL